MHRGRRTKRSSRWAEQRVGQEKRELTEQRKAYRWSGVLLRSSWWLVARNNDGPLEVFTLDGGGTLPVFSGEGEAELFLWLRETQGWEARESSAEELVFVLSGPSSRAGLVNLDPSTEIFDGQGAESLWLEPRRFSGVDRLQKPLTSARARAPSSSIPVELSFLFLAD